MHLVYKVYTQKSDEFKQNPYTEFNEERMKVVNERDATTNCGCSLAVPQVGQQN